MCFSPLASFSVGAILLGIGSVCTYTAAKKSARYIPLAFMPVAIGVQQIAEGFIWKSFEHGDAAQASNLAFLYMFFVWIFWPSWMGLSAASLEPQRKRR